MIQHLLFLFAGLLATFLLGLFGGMFLERSIFADPLAKTPLSLPQATEKAPQFTMDTNEAEVHYPVKLHLKWDSSLNITEKDIEGYFTLTPAVKGEWKWEKHLLWGGHTVEFSPLEPLPENLTVTANIPFLKEPFTRVFKKEKTTAEKNGELLLSCTPPKVESTTPKNGEGNVNPSLPVKIVWDRPIAWEEMFPLISVTPDLPENIKREMRLEKDESDPSGKSFVLFFSPYFPPEKEIKISISKGIKDIKTAYPSTEDFSLSFTTGKVQKEE